MKYITLVTLLALPFTAFGYDRASYGNWQDEDRDGLNTRHEVLLERSLVPVTMSKNGKRVLTGKWVGRYTKEVFYNSSDLDIDHILSVKEVDEICGDKLNKQQKKSFYNDRNNLAIVKKSENRKKGAKDEDGYLPPAMLHQEYIQIRADIMYKYCN